MLTIMNTQELLLQGGVSDTNNNNRPGLGAGEKCYSLRPRATNKPHDDEEVETWRPRGRTKRRTKQKPPPLSKYRRKTANARERSRMREINEAFEALRRAIPHLSTSSDNPNEKLTKITTLRLAMKYIAALNQALHQETPEMESDAESLLSDYALTPQTAVFSDHSLTSDFSSDNLSAFTPADLVSFADPIFVHPDDQFPCPDDHHFQDQFQGGTTGMSTTSGVLSLATSTGDSCLEDLAVTEAAYVFDDLTFPADFS